MRQIAALLIAAVLVATLVAGFSVTPARAACGTTYVVGQGETLSSIAQKCGLNYVVLSNINYEISNPDLIRPGQIIRLTAEEPLPFYTQPVSGPAQPYGLQPDGTYIVRPGDSLARIAYLYATTLNDLYLGNPQLGRRPVVFAGQVIALPPLAHKQKGWVGVSSLAPAPSSSIIVRAVDFPSYANITFRLHEIDEEELKAGIFNAGLQDIELDDTLSVYVDAKTDARGSSRATIRLPYWAYNGESWVVDAFTHGLGEADTLVRSPVMWIGGQDTE
jgi:LysM repeat protein